MVVLSSRAQERRSHEKFAHEARENENRHATQAREGENDATYDVD